MKQSVQLASSLLSISVLVVDDDSTSLSIVSALLKSWKYKVSTVRNSIDALSTLRVQTNIDLVVTDLHMPGMDGIELQKQIQQEFQLPVVIMSSDDDEGIIYNSLRCGAAYYMIKPVSPAELKNLWQYTIGGRKGKSVVPIQENPAPVLTPSPIPRHIHIVDDINSSSSVVNDKTVRTDCKRKSMSDPPNNNHDEQNTQIVVMATKKAKVVWTNSLHNRFLQAIRYLGLDKAVPKNILEFMNVPGLKRENVASHLQKYRIFLKKVAETGFFASKGLSDRVLRSSFATGHASLLLKNHLDSDLYPQFMDRYDYPLNPSTAMFLQQQSEAMANGYGASSSKPVNPPPGFGSQSVIMSHLYGLGQPSAVVGNPKSNPNRNTNIHYNQQPPNRSAPGTLNWTAYGNGGRSGYMSFANPMTPPTPSHSNYIVTSNVNGGNSRSNFGIKPSNVAPAYAGIRINTNSDIPRTSSQISSRNGGDQQQQGFINNSNNSFIMATATTIAPPGTNWTNAFAYDSGPQEKEVGYGRFGMNIGGSTTKHIQFQPSGSQNQNSLNLIVNELNSFDLNNANAYPNGHNFDFSKSNFNGDTHLDPNYSDDFSFFQKGVDQGSPGDNKNNPPNLPLLQNVPSWKDNQYPNGTSVKITTSSERSNHRVPDPNLRKNQGEGGTNIAGSSGNMASLNQDWVDEGFMDSLINSHPYD